MAPDYESHKKHICKIFCKIRESEISGIQEVSLSVYPYPKTAYCYSLENEEFSYLWKLTL